MNSDLLIAETRPRAFRLEKVRAAWRRAARHACGHQAVALADQAVVSATSFLALIMIGRWSDASQLGAYAVGGSVLALALAAQDALITRPYSVQLHRPQGSPAEHAFGALMLCLLLSSAGIVVVGAAAVALGISGASPLSAATAWALAGALPFVLMRDFARRFAFAHLRVPQALRIDAAAAALNVGLLAWLGWSGRLTAPMALMSIGGACGVTAIVWLSLTRKEFEPGLAQFAGTLKRSWLYGRWVLVNQFALQAQGYAVHWLSLAIAGMAVTGVYAACLSIVSLTNPIVFGLMNVMTPRSVRSLRTAGGPGLRRQAIRDALLLAALMSPFVACILLAGEDVLLFFYAGSEYEGNGHVLAVLVVTALVGALGTPAAVALASAERPRIVAMLTIVTAAFSIVLVWPAISHWGLLGGAYALLAAEAAGSIGRWIAFSVLVSELSGRGSGALPEAP